MTRSQYSVAEPIVEKIRNLEKLKDSFPLLAENYHIEIKANNGSRVIFNASDIRVQGMRLMISTFRGICESEIERLTAELEEI